MMPIIIIIILTIVIYYYHYCCNNIEISRNLKYTLTLLLPRSQC